MFVIKEEYKRVNDRHFRFMKQYLKPMSKGEKRLKFRPVRGKTKLKQEIHKQKKQAAAITAGHKVKTDQQATTKRPQRNPRRRR